MQKNEIPRCEDVRKGDSPYLYTFCIKANPLRELCTKKRCHRGSDECVGHSDIDINGNGEKFYFTKELIKRDLEQKKQGIPATCKAAYASNLYDRVTNPACGNCMMYSVLQTLGFGWGNNIETQRQLIRYVCVLRALMNEVMEMYIDKQSPLILPVVFPEEYEKINELFHEGKFFGLGEPLQSPTFSNRLRGENRYLGYYDMYELAVINFFFGFPLKVICIQCRDTAENIGNKFYEFHEFDRPAHSDDKFPFMSRIYYNGSDHFEALVPNMNMYSEMSESERNEWENYLLHKREIYKVVKKKLEKWLEVAEDFGSQEVEKCFRKVTRHLNDVNKSFAATMQGVEIDKYGNETSPESKRKVEKHESYHLRFLNSEPRTPKEIQFHEEFVEAQKHIPMAILRSNDPGSAFFDLPALPQHPADAAGEMRSSAMSSAGVPGSSAMASAGVPRSPPKEYDAKSRKIAWGEEVPPPNKGAKNTQKKRRFEFDEDEDEDEVYRRVLEESKKQEYNPAGSSGAREESHLPDMTDWPEDEVIAYMEEYSKRFQGGYRRRPNTGSKKREGRKKTKCHQPHRRRGHCGRRRMTCRKKYCNIFRYGG